MQVVWKRLWLLLDPSFPLPYEQELLIQHHVVHSGLKCKCLAPGPRSEGGGATAVKGTRFGALGWRFSLQAPLSLLSALCHLGHKPRHTQERQSLPAFRGLGPREISSPWSGGPDLQEQLNVQMRARCGPTRVFFLKTHPTLPCHCCSSQVSWEKHSRTLFRLEEAEQQHPTCDNSQKTGFPW